MQVNVTLADRVDAGARFLDRVRPGWHARVDVDRLDVGDRDRCVLAQVFDATYGVVMLKLDLDRDDGLTLGFTLTEGDSQRFDASVGALFVRLTQRWRVEVLCRRRRVTVERDLSQARRAPTRHLQLVGTGS